MYSEVSFDSSQLNNLGECMMNAKFDKLYNENDIEIHESGISVAKTFFDKKKIADVFNELIIINNVINAKSDE